MSRQATQDDYVKTALRLPRDLHKAVHDAAAKAERTFNSQIITTLREAHLPQSKKQEAPDAKAIS